MRKSTFLLFLFSLLFSASLYSQENIALSKSVSASSTAGSNLATTVNDGLTDKFWTSTFGQDNQWIVIDLGDVYRLSSAKINWAAASAKDYDFEVSANGNDWVTAEEKAAMTSGVRVDEFDFQSNSKVSEIRYVRLNLKTRNSALGFAILEWEVYGTLKAVSSVPTKLDVNPKNAILLTDFPEELSILSLNNSLIAYNDQAIIFNELAQSAGKKAVWTPQTRLGRTLQFHYDENDGAELSARTVVSSKAWTHIILQEQSNKPVVDYQGFIESVRTWVDYIKTNCPNPNARVILMLNWPYSTSTDYAGDQAKLLANYKSIAQELGIMICPSGTAFDLVRTIDGNLGSLYTDDRHPSPLASYLSACTFYSMFFDESPVGKSSKPASVSQADATRMQNRAWEAYQSHTDVVSDTKGVIRYNVDVLDQFNRPMSTDNLDWTVSGGGTLNNNIFTSNGENGTYTVTVKSGLVEGTASIDVVQLEDGYFAEIGNEGLYNQDFNSIGTSATATLPIGWKVEKRLDAPLTLGTFDAAITATEQIGGNNISGSTKNGIYNFGAGDATTAIDRAIGGVSTGVANGTRCVNIYLKVRNTGSKAINELNIAYDVEKYRKGANAAGFVMQMYYSTDGVTWTSAGDAFKTFFDKDAATEGYVSAPGQVVNVSATLDKNISAGSDLYLAWNYSVASGLDAQGAQALALDNLVISKVEKTDFVEIIDDDKYTQDFDVIGTSATATLPIGWKVEKRLDAPRTLGSFYLAANVTEQVGGNGLSATTKNGIYNFGAGVPAVATDRALGGVSTGIDGGTRCVNAYLKIRNSGTTGINSFDIRYDVEKYRKGTNAAGFVMQMYYSTDGERWMSAGDSFKTFFEKDATTEGYTLAPGEVKSVSAILTQSTDVGEDLYLAWNYSVASGLDAQAAQALALDNVEISVNSMMTSVADESDELFNINYNNKTLYVTGKDITLISVYDITGNQVAVFRNEGIFDMSALSSGIYFIKINNQKVYKIKN